MKRNRILAGIMAMLTLLTGCGRNEITAELTTDTGSILSEREIAMN